MNKKIAVLTSGGDAPGMNACIRASVRTSIYYDFEVFGVFDGFEGLLEGKIKKMNYKDVSNIIQQGGTMLGTARSEEFRTKEGRKKAIHQLEILGIDKILVIGGDGSFQGARLLQEEGDIHVMACPGTIDNDLGGTDYTIGFDTALNTVVEAVDKIRDTASAHHRLFFIEVMGRDAGFIALRSGIGVGAEDILIPEVNASVDALVDKLSQSQLQSKSSIVIVSEGNDAGGAFDIAKQVKEQLPDYDARVTVLGHVQRGGRPSAFDRLLATKVGHDATLNLINDESGFMIGWKNNNTIRVPLIQAIKGDSVPETGLLDIVKILSAY